MGIINNQPRNPFLFDDNTPGFFAPQTPQSDTLAGGLTVDNLLNLLLTGNPSQPPTTGSITAPSTSVTPPTPSAPGNAPGPQVQGNSRFTFNNPFYSSVTSPLLNQAGNQIGTTPLNNRQFARPEMANALLRYFADTYGLNNGNIVTEQYAGGLGPSENELGIRFGNSNVLNAGLEYDRLQNRNGYSQPYLDAQFKDNLTPGSSGWNNYVTTGSMPGAMNSADAERIFAGNPDTDPNMNMFGLQSKLNQVQYNPVGGVTPSGWEGQNRGTQNYNNNWNQTSMTSPGGFFANSSNGFRSLPGNSGFSNYASAMNNRAPLYNGSYNIRGTTGTYGRGY